MWISRPARSSSIAARPPRTATSCFRRACAWCTKATCTLRRAIDIYSRLGGSGPFTTRRIQQVVQGYREMPGITQPLHPSVPPSDADLSDSQRDDRRTDSADFRPRKQKSLEVYQHLSLESFDKAYQDAVQSVGI